MDAADVVSTKPGGLTSSEVLAKGKPMIIVDPIPGQEQRNCECLLEDEETGMQTRLVHAPFAVHTARLVGVVSELSGKDAGILMTRRLKGSERSHRVNLTTL
jgi:UDP-N-acetylglucosamine:LPS N-acetylglucosamine transferase